MLEKGTQSLLNRTIKLRVSGGLSKQHSVPKNESLPELKPQLEVYQKFLKNLRAFPTKTRSVPNSPIRYSYHKIANKESESVNRNLLEVFNSKKYLPFLPTDIPKLPPPYVAAAAPINPKISVTQLLTDSWCELRSYYDSYACSRAAPSAAMVSGTEQHKFLEDKTHQPEINVTKDIQKDFTPIMADQLKKLERSLNLISRFIDLLTIGKAREFAVTAIINKETKEFVDVNTLQQLAFIHQKSPCYNDQFILASGYLDYLRSESYVIGLEKEKWTQHNYSLNTLLETSIKGPFTVIDVKTRGKPIVTKSKGVLIGHRYQVGLYRKFLGLMSGENVSGVDSPISVDQVNETAYSLLVADSIQRGYDVDEPVHPMVGLVMLANNPWLITMLEQMCVNDFLGNSLYDTFNAQHSTEYSWELSQVNSKDFHSVLEPSLLERTEKLFTKWKRPLSLRSITALISKFYPLISKKLSQNTKIMYYTDGECFHTSNYLYNPKAINTFMEDKVKFLIGQRPPRPIEKLEIPQKCGFCRFQSICEYSNLYNPVT
ncbi:BA75_02901T0 [Komagataella pastoris]|uniref:Exonuclease V, mitochondrial n=1 Tax=Komagataella pastoris TaxID=4922 RepID=A0A1B2JDX0_PICPA|nr:BA75_02901T0 [Komagataella pastoris]